MDAQTILIRTPMGREPAMLRMLRLSAEQRWLLELIDGTRTVAELELLCSDLRYGHTALDRLAVWGLIAPLAAPAVVSPAASGHQASDRRRQAGGNDAQLLARLLAAKPVAETLLTRAALDSADSNRAARHA